MIPVLRFEEKCYCVDVSGDGKYVCIGLYSVKNRSEYTLEGFVKLDSPSVRRLAGFLENELRFMEEDGKAIY